MKTSRGHGRFFAMRLPAFEKPFVLFIKYMGLGIQKLFFFVV